MRQNSKEYREELRRKLAAGHRMMSPRLQRVVRMRALVDMLSYQTLTRADREDVVCELEKLIEEERDDRPHSCL